MARDKDCSRRGHLEGVLKSGPLGEFRAMNLLSAVFSFPLELQEKLCLKALQCFIGPQRQPQTDICHWQVRGGLSRNCFVQLFYLYFPYSGQSFSQYLGGLDFAPKTRTQVPVINSFDCIFFSKMCYSGNCNLPLLSFCCCCNSFYWAGILNKQPFSSALLCERVQCCLESRWH